MRPNSFSVLDESASEPSGGWQVRLGISIPQVPPANVFRVNVVVTPLGTAWDYRCWSLK